MFEIQSLLKQKYTGDIWRETHFIYGFICALYTGNPYIWLEGVGFGSEVGFVRIFILRGCKQGTLYIRRGFFRLYVNGF